MKKEKDKKEKKPSFLSQVALCPEPIRKRFWRQLFAAVGFIALTIIMLIYFRDWSYCFGFLISLYIAYLGFDILWQYQGNKIVRKTMLCLHVRQGIGKIHVVMKDLDAVSESQEKAVREFLLVVDKKDRKLFEPNVVFNVYFNESNPMEIIAWDVADVIVK